MTLTELKYVVALAQERHFGRAAAKCFVTQPTLSLALAKLEDELGVKLFERNKNEVLVTGRGEAIVEQARREAEAYAAEARSKLKEMIERRSASARQKIAQAETAALKDVRAAAAEMAVAMAARVLKDELKGEPGRRLIDRSIADLRDKLN